MKIRTNKTAVHSWMFSATIIFAVGFLSNIWNHLSGAVLTLVLVTSALTIALGYFRPFLRRWIRWTLLAWMLYVCAGACGGDDLIGEAWGGMNLCLFAVSIAIRRMAMLLTGDRRVADNSTLRKLYSFFDKIYVKAATKMDAVFRREGAGKMVPLGHTMAMLTFGLFMLMVFVKPYAKLDTEVIYLMYGSFMLLVPMIYAIGFTHGIKKFGYNLVVAYSMSLVGAVAVVASIFIIVFALMAIQIVVDGVRDFFRRLLGRD